MEIVNGDGLVVVLQETMGNVSDVENFNQQVDEIFIQVDQMETVNDGIISMQKSAGGVLLPKSAVKFERYLMGEVLCVGSEVGEVKAGKKVGFSESSAEIAHNSPTKYQRLWLIDHSNNKVHATLYDNNITTFQDILLPSKTYLIFNTVVKFTKEQYKAFFGEIQ
ncbi:putative groES chaperonin family [Forsythia ovata]|uniref:GroES chaperonin family n=1 Tax=Forsythia ovata TaxID=205694 RepID=A0ABD1TCR1_9LAMI